jgi:hypothetical protein
MPVGCPENGPRAGTLFVKEFEMKKSVVVVMIGILLAGFLLAACAGVPPAQGSRPVAAPGQPAAPASAVQRENVTIDWRGANLGGQIPEWVHWAGIGDPDNLIAGLPRVNGKKTILLQYSGQDLDLLQVFGNQNALADASISIRTNVEVEGGNSLEGNKNTPGNRSFIAQFITIFSETEISGLGRELDFWIKERSPSGEESYSYYLVYGITEENFNYLVEQALGKVQASTEEEREMADEIRSRMRQLRFKATGE